MIKKLLAILLIFLQLFYIGCNNENIAANTINNDLIVHFIDVGQGDSILIQVNNKNLLIDSGSKSERTKIINYLNSLDIHSLDYVIATHPHEDHIGNMAEIINTYPINKFYAPKIENTTKTFELMIEALKNNNLKINSIHDGTNSIKLGKNTKVHVFSPMSDEYDNLNNYSPVIKLEYGDTSFLFTGDAEKEIEQAILAENYDISADVIKIAHHGSTTSTSPEFIEAVDPYISVISVGIDNCYGHPNKKTLSLLANYDLTIFRTDIDGTIRLYSDGKNIYK